MTLLLLLGQGVTVAGAPVYIGLDANLTNVQPPLRIRARNYEAVPYLLDESGAILCNQDGQPLISQAQIGRRAALAPTLIIREVQ